MENFKIISTVVWTLVFVNQLHFTQCSEIHASPTKTPRLSAPSSPRQANHPTHPLQIRFSTQQAKAYVTTLSDLLRTIISSNEFRDGSSALHQLLAVLRPLVRAVGVISQPPSPSLPLKIIDDTTTTTTTLSTPHPMITTFPPADQGSSKKLMSLFIPMYAVPSTTTTRPLTIKLPKLFRKVDS